MSQPKLYLAVTSHGFGHAVRAASVAAQIKQICPEIELIFATTAPEWLLKSYVGENFIYRPRRFDVGVIQKDSLSMDKSATLKEIETIKEQQEALIAEEAAFIQQEQIRLILADIPPLATAIAQKAQIPCWMMSNFGWDFIYRPWGQDFAEIVNWIEACYSKCDLLFRLPLNEPMSSFPVITDVGLTGGTPKYTTDELREKFALEAPSEKTILLTFGGLGLEAIPYENLKRFADWQFITFDRQAPDLPNLLKVGGQSYRPVDFMPLCGRVISKPGYSTFAEALRLEIPLVSLTREGFAESPVLLAGIQDYAYHQIISYEDFFASDWSFLFDELNPPQTNKVLNKNGSETIAQEVIHFLR